MTDIQTDRQTNRETDHGTVTSIANRNRRNRLSTYHVMSPKANEINFVVYFVKSMNQNENHTACNRGCYSRQWRRVATLSRQEWRLSWRLACQCVMTYNGCGGNWLWSYKQACYTQVLRVTGMKNRMDATHDSAFSLAYMIILHLRFVNH